MQDSCTCHSLSHLENIPWSNNFSRTLKQLSIARCPKVWTLNFLVVLTQHISLQNSCKNVMCKVDVVQCTFPLLHMLITCSTVDIEFNTLMVTAKSSGSMPLARYCQSFRSNMTNNGPMAFYGSNNETNAPNQRKKQLHLFASG